MNLPSERTLELEFAWTSHDDSCRDLYNIDQYCRRPRGHEDAHASGFGLGLSFW